jgi:hypothetical protein
MARGTDERFNGSRSNFGYNPVADHDSVVGPQDKTTFYGKQRTAPGKSDAAMQGVAVRKAGVRRGPPGWPQG